MSLFTATLILSLLLTLKGTLCLLNPNWVKKTTQRFYRDNFMAYILFGSASLGFLWHILHLGEADYGQYKGLIFIGFALISLGSFLFVKEFLAVRGWAIILLLLSKEFLDAAFLEEPTGRLFLVGFTYLMILIALYIAALPYKLRDLTDWLFAKISRVRIFALSFLLYGLLLGIVAFSY